MHAIQIKTAITVQAIQPQPRLGIPMAFDTANMPFTRQIPCMFKT